MKSTLGLNLMSFSDTFIPLSANISARILSKAKPAGMLSPLLSLCVFIAQSCLTLQLYGL